MHISFIEFFVIFIMIVVVLMFIRNYYGEVEYVKSNLDERYYLVQKLPDREEAADYLADINASLMKLVKHMMAKYPNNKNVEQLYRNYNPDSISEGSIESEYTSYSVNKGEKIILCIRQTNKSFVEKNVVLYVAIHELGHLMTIEIGHTDTFWFNFKLLLKEAIALGIYYKVNFNERPEDYCGIKITTSII